MEPSNECPVCISTYNNTTRKKVKCYCKFEVCSGCCKQYLLELNTDPRCMNCSVIWTPNIIIENINYTFYSQKLKSHLMNLYLIKEKAKVPQMQYKASLLNRESLLFNKIKENKKSIIIYKQQIDLYRIAYYNNYSQNENFIEFKIINDHLSKIEHYNTEIEQYKFELGAINAHLIKDKNNVSSIRRQFLFRCKNDDCGGYIEDSSYKCKTCNMKTCNDCYVIISDENHVCNEDNIKTAKFIKNSTKNCPKCAIPIYRSIGCDNMWCTECHTSFNWKTLIINNNKYIDNPHYFEWQRLNTGTVDRNPNEGCITQYGDCIDLLRNSKNPKLSNYDKNVLCTLCSAMEHNRHIIYAKYQRDPAENDTELDNLRMNYVRNIISLSQWKLKLFAFHKRLYFRRDICNVIEIYISTTLAILVESCNNLSFSEVIAQLKNITKYSTCELEKIHTYYKNTIPKLSFRSQDLNTLLDL
jgi:hypothetical protein